MRQYGTSSRIIPYRTEERGGSCLPVVPPFSDNGLICFPLVPRYTTDNTFSKIPIHGFIFKGVQVWDFDRSDCHDFYTIKSLWVGYFGVKILIKYLIFGRARHHLNYYAHAEHTRKFTNIFNNLKYLKKQKFWHYKWLQKLPKKKFLFGQTQKNVSLKLGWAYA